MRPFIYTLLAIVATAVIVDTYFGESVRREQQVMVSDAIALIRSRGLVSDARLLEEIQSAGKFRSSWVLNRIARFSRESDGDFGFHAFTPVLSRTRIFLGQDFCSIGPEARASILVHEAQHIRRHQRRFLRGIPREEDESEAYYHQYKTYPLLGLHEECSSQVYWDMMIGIQQFVVPRKPDIAKRLDVRRASKYLAGDY